MLKLQAYKNFARGNLNILSSFWFTLILHLIGAYLYTFAISLQDSWLVNIFYPLKNGIELDQIEAKEIIQSFITIFVISLWQVQMLTNSKWRIVKRSSDELNRKISEIDKEYSIGSKNESNGNSKYKLKSLILSYRLQQIYLCKEILAQDLWAHRSYGGMFKKTLCFCAKLLEKEELENELSKTDGEIQIDENQAKELLQDGYSVLFKNHPLKAA
ncbi:MAG: hypothetical protein AB8G05_24020 [Oligoflexales bacterium]